MSRGLPNEIFTLIFGKFCLHCSENAIPTAETNFTGTCQQRDEPSWYSLNRQTLTSLCFVSRRFRNLAQEILYHEFAIGYGDSWRSTRYTWDRRLSLFVRTITQRRHLAGFVRRVLIHWYLLKYVGWDEARYVVEMTTQALGLDMLEIRARRRASGDQEFYALTNVLDFLFLDNPNPTQGPGGARPEWLSVLAFELVAALLALLPTLHHLSLHAIGGDIGPLPLSALRAFCGGGVEEISPLSCLKTLQITGRARAERGGFPLFKQIIPLLVPSLETLDLHMCHGYTAEKMLPVMPHLQAIRITHGRLGKNAVAALLRLSPSAGIGGLRVFAYEEAGIEKHEIGPCGTYTDYDQFFGRPGNATPYCLLPSDFVGQLQQYHEKTLRSLHIDLRHLWFLGLDGTINSNESNRAEVNRESFQSIPSLKSFDVLEHLFLNSNAVINNFNFGKKGKKHAAAEAEADKHRLTRLLPPSIVSLHISTFSHLRDLEYDGFPQGSRRAEYVNGMLIPRLARALLGLAEAVSPQQQHSDGGRQFTKLKEVMVDEEQRGLDEDGYGTVFGNLFAAAGVKFGYRRWLPSQASIQMGDPLTPPPDPKTIVLPDEEDSDL